LVSAALCFFAFLRVPSRHNASTRIIPIPATPPTTLPIIIPLFLPDSPRLSTPAVDDSLGGEPEAVAIIHADWAVVGVAESVVAACIEGEMLAQPDVEFARTPAPLTSLLSCSIMTERLE
jgi:hypothetical protein